MNSLSIVSHDLTSSRRALQDASEHLAHSVSHSVFGYDRDTELRRAVEATVRAVTSLSQAIERLAELDVAEPAEPATTSMYWRD